MLNYNRVIQIEDFSDNDLQELIRDIFAYEISQFPANYPNGVADSKQWEIAMAVRTLRDYGKLTRNATVLGVGSGIEITPFYLTKHVGQVFATDIYADANVWSDVAPSAFLASPGLFAPIEYEPRRLLPVHMDARSLRFPDDYFDGVYSSGSIEHFGSLDAVANAAFEIGRVLKPGGIATISTQFKLGGPPESDGWDPSIILFSAEKLRKHIVDASGLELVDDVQLDVSDSTLGIRRDLSKLLENTRAPISTEIKVANYPNLILYHEGYLYCSVHVALRKTASFPFSDNAWAMPAKELRAKIETLVPSGFAQTGIDFLKKVSQSSPAPVQLPSLREQIRHRMLRNKMLWRVTAFPRLLYRMLKVWRAR